MGILNSWGSEFYDQVPLDIPHEEGLMFKTKCTYLKTFDIVWDFDLAENDMAIYWNQCKPLCSHCSALRDHSTNLIVTIGPHVLTVMMLSIPRGWGGICVQKPAQAHCSVQSSFCQLFSFYTLFWAELHMHLPLAGLANSRSHSHSFD